MLYFILLHSRRRKQQNLVFVFNLISDINDPTRLQKKKIILKS